MATGESHTSADRDFVLFKTGLFLFDQPDGTIDCWRVGVDCASWFYARLIRTNGIDPRYEPLMEDWGWTFAVRVGTSTVWINLWQFHEENCWLFGLETRKHLLRSRTREALSRAKEAVSGALDEIMSAEPRVSKHQWFAQNPFNLKIKDFCCGGRA